MKILAIDPGYERLGIAVLQKKSREKEVLLYSECFITNKNQPHSKRLTFIGRKIKTVIKKYSVSALAIENLFLNTNQKTAMRVSEARGVILYEAASHNLEVFEYSPPQIKLAVCGNGRADKTAIMKMVPLLVSIKKEVKYDDEYDAIAIGIACFANVKFN